MSDSGKIFNKFENLRTRWESTKFEKNQNQKL